MSLHSPLSAVQWGFQSGKSTELALLNTVYMEERLDVGTVFFEAFDYVIGACICSHVDLHVCVCGSAHCGCVVNGSVAMAAF